MRITRNTPEARDRISAEQKARFSDPEEIAKLAERVRKAFENPEVVAKHSESQRKRFEDPAERQKVADGVSAHFSKPGEREAQSARITAYFDTPGAREKASEAQKKRFEDPAERQKVADGVNKYFAEHGGRKHDEKTKEKIRIKRTAYCALVRAEKKLAATADENRAAAQIETPLSDLKEFFLTQPIKPHSTDDKKVQREMKRAAKMMLKVTEQNQAAAHLMMPNLKIYHVEHSDKIKMPLPKGYAALATPIKKSKAGRATI